MRTVEVRGQTGMSNIAVGESLENLKKYLPKNVKAVIITDKNVKHYYLPQFPPCDVIQIDMGEKIKTLETVRCVYEKLIELEFDRSCYIVGIGGGIVCDITGYIASTYMRGLDFGFVSTTLLSQVDASVGGKNGVNFQGYKNMIGVFNQPDFVICDQEMLKTLPQQELLCGFGEIVKNAAIGSHTLFSYLESNYQKALIRDKDTLERLVYDSVIIKAGIVTKDEKEKGERRVLNFGHTLAHALERITGIRHGQAVSIGMVFAANLSVKKNLLPLKEAQRLKQLLELLELPTEIFFKGNPPKENYSENNPLQNIDKKKVLDALKRDKKRAGSGIHFVLLEAIGKPVVEELSIQELKEVIDDMC
ncbi:MAG: 3-dehydroquinate synthase [bacterium]|nr:3-dehydroquinate synthase [bacterium]